MSSLITLVQIGLVLDALSNNWHWVNGVASSGLYINAFSYGQMSIVYYGGPIYDHTLLTDAPLWNRTENYHHC